MLDVLALPSCSDRLHRPSGTYGYGEYGFPLDQRRQNGALICRCECELEVSCRRLKLAVSGLACVSPCCGGSFGRWCLEEDDHYCRAVRRPRT